MKMNDPLEDSYLRRTKVELLMLRKQPQWPILGFLLFLLDLIKPSRCFLCEN